MPSLFSPAINRFSSPMRSPIPKPSRRGWESRQKTSIFQRVSRWVGGAEGNRTPDLCSAIAALSHLSYGPGTGAIYVAGPGIVKERRGEARRRAPPQLAADLDARGLIWGRLAKGPIGRTWLSSRPQRSPVDGALQARTPSGRTGTNPARSSSRSGATRGWRSSSRAGRRWWIADAGPLWRDVRGITHDGHPHGPRVPRCSSCSASSVP